MSPEVINLIVALILVAVIVAVVRYALKLLKDCFGSTTVYETHRGLLYDCGKLKKVLEPGKYWLFKPNTYVQQVDVRQWVLSVPHQEVLTADNVAVRISTAAKVQVVDPVLAETKNVSYTNDLYLVFQLALRELVSQVKADELLLQRNAISDQLFEKCKPAAAAVGVAVESAGIKDITFPGELKKVFAQIVQAEKAGQAALTKARAEVASLRALANAAKMLDDNPNLVTLRTLHSISELASGSGNTIVYGVPSPIVPLRTSASAASSAAAKTSKTGDAGDFDSADI